MEINITGKNLKITTGMRDYVNRKITKVISLFEQPINCDIILEVEKRTHSIEIILRGDSGRFYFKKEADDLYKAMDNVIHAAQISIKKFKEKQKNRKFKSKESIRRDEYGRAIRIKKIEVNDIKPMTIEEAVLQLRYIRQNILVFQNAGNFKTYVLFRNREEYNLIQPKVTFLFKFLFPRSLKNKYKILSLSYDNNKIKKVKKKKSFFNTLPYDDAYNKIVNVRGLSYLIFNNSNNDRICVLFKINRNLIGYYEC